MNGSDCNFNFNNKKLLFISHDAVGAPGTASKYYYPAIATSLGAQVAVVGNWPGDKPILPRGIKVFDLSASANLIERAREIRKIVNTFRPDIVHVFFHRGVGLYRRYCSDFDAKWIVDVRGPLLVTGLRRCISRLLNSFDCFGYDAIAGHSTGSVETVFGIASARHMQLTRIGVDVKQFEYSPHRTVSPFRMVYVGNLDKRRELKKMLKAFALASKLCAVELYLIGEGDAVCDLKDFVDAENLSGVRFLGYFPHNEVAGVLSQFDGAVSYIGPKVYDPAPPLKTLEYFACGLPVVASNTTGNRMLMESGVEGIIDDGDTVESLSKAMVKLVHSDIEILSKNARKRAEEYDWKGIVANDLTNLYSRVMT